MGLRLQRDVRVAVGPDGPVLCREGVPVAHRLQVAEALALSFLDGFGRADMAAATLSDCLEADVGPALIQRVTQRYHCYIEEADAPLEGGETDGGLGLEIEPAVNIAWLRALGHCAPRPVRAAAPEAITWLVTLGCNRRCPYCFYDVTFHAAEAPDSPADASLPQAQAVSMVREMGRIGAADLYLTGGEPLLRQDLVEIIAEASAARVRTHIVTKYLIEAPLARRLADAGVHRVTVSLDDARPGRAAALAGARNYLAEATRTVRALLEAGIRVEVNCVVTRLNQDGLEQLAEHLIDLGVEIFKLGTYTPPPSGRPPGQRLLPGPAMGAGLPAVIRALQDRFGGKLRVESSGSQLPDESPCGNELVCDVGVHALDVLPDGSVTRCRYLPGHQALIVGSVREQSLLDIWNGVPLRRLIEPDRDVFAGSACHGCEGVAGCNARGRCYFTALQRSGRLHAPDAFCRK
jgi:MoaA/NifB/PqqE/SkfB family radical SAM enzyme